MRIRDWSSDVCSSDLRDPAAASQWLAIAHWDPGPPRRIRSAVSLANEDVLRDQAERLNWQNVVQWSDKDQFVIAEQQRRLGAIVLDRKPLRLDDRSEEHTSELQSLMRIS